MTKTANVARMTENLEAVKVELSIGEMEKVDDLTELGQQIFLDSYKVV